MKPCCVLGISMLSHLIITYTPAKKVISMIRRGNPGSKSTPKSVELGSAKVRIQTLIFWLQDTQHRLSREPTVPIGTRRKGCWGARRPIQWKMREPRASSIHFAFNSPLTCDQAVELILKPSWGWVYFELSYPVTVQRGFNKRPTCARHRARPRAQPRPPSPTAPAPREWCEQRGDIRSHGAWPASRGGRGASGAGSRRPSQHGLRSGTLITQSALAGSRVPPTPGRVRPPPGLEDTPAPRPPALGRAGSGDAERGGRNAKGLPARGHLPAPGRGAGPRPRNWGHPVGLGSKPGHQAANSLVTGRAAAGATSRGTTLDGFPSRPPSPPSS